jgi:integrase
MLYRLALGTGFRASELASLVPDSFNLDGQPPTVTVEAGYSKHRRRDVQPIRRDLAAMLQPWLEGKTPGLPVFNMPDKPVKLVQADLAAARDAWIEEAASEKERDEREKSSFLKYRDAAGHVADFHALRHTFISRLVRSGVNVKVAQELARHSTPTLTLGRYAHVQLVDQTRALDALPAIEERRTARRPLHAAGTNSA